MIESTEIRKDNEILEEDYSVINNYLETNNKIAIVILFFHYYYY